MSGKEDITTTIHIFLAREPFQSMACLLKVGLGQIGEAERLRTGESKFRNI